MLTFVVCKPIRYHRSRQGYAHTEPELFFMTRPLVACALGYSSISDEEEPSVRVWLRHFINPKQFTSDELISHSDSLMIGVGTSTGWRT